MVPHNSIVKIVAGKLMVLRPGFNLIEKIVSQSLFSFVIESEHRIAEPTNQLKPLLLLCIWMPRFTLL